jgi:hypothetical protein
MPPVDAVSFDGQFETSKYSTRHAKDCPRADGVLVWWFRMGAVERCRSKAKAFRDAEDVSSLRDTEKWKEGLRSRAATHGRGFLIYSVAELMNPDHPAWKNTVKPTDKEKVSAFDGFSRIAGDMRSMPESTLSCTCPKSP